MSLIDVLEDLGLEILRQLQVQHGSVGQINPVCKLLGFTIQLINIGGHVSNNHGIEYCAA